MMKTNVEFEYNNENESDKICSESGTYICALHPYIEKYIIKDEPFPKCDQKNLPHSTKWNKISEN